MNDRPSKGRYFPMGIGHILAAIRRIGVKRWDGGPLPFRLLNPRPAQEREGLVAEFRPLQDLRLYSLPETVEPVVGQALWQVALDATSELARRRTAPHSGHGPVYALLGGVGDRPSRVVARW